MKKFIFFNIQLISLFIISLINKPIINNEIYVNIEEISVINNDYYKISDNNINLYYNNFHLISLDSNDKFNYLIYNDSFYLCYIENYELNFLVYNNSGKNIINKKYDYSLFSYFYGNIKMMLLNNDIYIMTTSDKNNSKDLVLINTDLLGNVIKINYYGGDKEEEFIDFEIINNNFYVLIKHDKMSYGCFIQAGNYILVLIKDSKIDKMLAFNEEIFCDLIKTNENQLGISFSNSIYLYDYELNQIKGLKFQSESIFTSLSFNNLALVITDSKLIIITLQNDFIIYEKNIDSLINNTVIEKIWIFDNNIYIQSIDPYNTFIYNIKIFDIRNFIIEVNHSSISENNILEYNNTIHYWFYEVEGEKDLSKLDNSVNGKYSIECTYKIDNYLFKKDMIINIMKEENVKEGMIYPKGYFLLFKGTAFLNNQMINNNYLLQEEGDYTLDLYSNIKEKRTIHFKVSNNQVNCESINNIDTDYECEINENFFINYDLDYEINKIYINNEEYNNWRIDNKKLIICFNYDTLGIKKIYINKFEYSDNEMNINKVYDQSDIIYVNIIDSPPITNLSIQEKSKEIECVYSLENGQSVKGFKLYLDNDLYKTFDLSTNELLLPYNKNANTVKITYFYDIGSTKLYEDTILCIDLNENVFELGQISIIKKEESINNFKIIIYKKPGLYKMHVLDEIVYTNNELNQFNNYTFIYILIIIFIIIFLSLFLFTKYKKKKKL